MTLKSLVRLIIMRRNPELLSLTEARLILAWSEVGISLGIIMRLDSVAIES
jgi:hypothetical protein